MSKYNEDFINIYPIMKTIKTELIPIGKTEETILKNKIIESDTVLEKNIEIIKQMTVESDREFIRSKLLSISLDWVSLHSVIVEYWKDKKEMSSKFGSEKRKYRKIIANELRSDLYFKESLGKKLITEILPSRTKNDDEEKAIKALKGFTTFLKKNNDARKNMFSDKDETTGIANRIVDENFLIFAENLNLFKYVNDNYRDNLVNFIDNSGLGITIDELEEIFTINGYNNRIEQDGIDFYNEILGGYTIDNKNRLNGLNETIKELQDSNKDKKLAILKKLRKQILGESRSESFTFEIIDNDEKVIAKIYDFYNKVITKNSFTELIDVLKNIVNLDTKEIYINVKELNRISNDVFSDFKYIENCLIYWNYSKRKSNREKIKELDKYYKKTLLTLADIIEAIKSYGDDSNVLTKQYFNELIDLSRQIEPHLNELVIKIEKHNINIELKKQKALVSEIKTFFEEINFIMSKTKIFLTSDNRMQNKYYYSLLDGIIDSDLREGNSIYNMIRNYITKAESVNKSIKLTFHNPQFAGGWHHTKERDYSSFLLKDEKFYYLGIYEDKKAKLESIKNEEAFYEKMKIDYFPEINKMIPKCSFTKSVKTHFNDKKTDINIRTDKFNDDFFISKEIYNLYQERNFKNSNLETSMEKDDNNKLKMWIKFCLSFLACYKSTSIFDISSVAKRIDKYNNVNDFYSDINALMYNITYTKISKERIDSLVNEGKIYLFKIYNKDFAEESKGKENLHTMYLKAVLNGSSNIRLAGNAELFFRERKNGKRIIHKKGSTLINKTTKDGQFIPTAVYYELYKKINGEIMDLSDEAEKYENLLVTKTARYDIEKDRRFNSNKYYFYIPIELNYKAIEKNEELVNERIRTHIKKSNDLCILGIDRGERNLIYAVLIDLKGRILWQKSFNEIESLNSFGERKVNYLGLLSDKEKERQEARKNWDRITNIKELKKGYLSNVVYQIAKIIYEKNAIVILEDLNLKFLNKRKKIEKEVYQRLEKQLINKLNYLTFKDKKINEIGGINKGLQLTNKFVSFKKLTKQTGVMFYVPAGYTSKIDPTTGFTNIFNLKLEKLKIEEFIQKFDSICYFKKENMFSISFDYKDFFINKENLMKKTKWTIWTNGVRYSRNKQRVTEEINLTEILKNYLESNEITYKDGRNLLMCSDLKGNDDFNRILFDIIRYTIQLRNIDNDNNDFIISPVRNKYGQFFDSRNSNDELPLDADANGAYCVALKGLMLKERIDNDNTNLIIRNKDWFDYIQNK